MSLLINPFAVAPTVVPPGYDVIPLIGDSNLYYGATLDGGIDVGHARMYAYAPEGPDAETIALAQDPFQHYEYAWSSDPDGKIGFAGQWGRDYLAANATRKILFVPYGRGGSTAVSWGSGGTLRGPATALCIAALAAAQADLPDSDYKAIFIQLGTNDLQDASVVSDLTFRRNLHALIDYLRVQLGNLSLPIVVGGLPHDVYETNPSTWGTADMGAKYRGVLSNIANKIPYLGYADSENPSNLGAAIYHFTAAEQRSMATRYETARVAAELNANPSLLWDANDKGGNMNIGNGVFTGSDVTSGATAAWQSIRATAGRNSGKYYIEISVAGAGGNRRVGLSNAVFPMEDTFYLGSAANSATYSPNEVAGWTKDWSGSPAGWADGDVIMFAVDFTAGKVWVGRNGTWENSGDPAAGTGWWISGIPAGQTIWPSVSMYANESNPIKLRRAAQFTHTIPTGFSAWG